MQPLDVLFVVRSLGIGGAERQLVVLARGLARRGRRVGIAQFYPGGPLAEGLASEGIALFSLEKKGRADLFGFLFRVRDLLRMARPRVCHGYLPVPNLVALTARLASPSTRVVWGVRDAGVAAGFYDRLTHLSFWLTRWLARFADLIVANSSEGRDRHAELGYPAKALHVIPNGIDTQYFMAPTDSRDAVRERLGLPPGVPLVGCVARMDPLKGIDVVLTAMSVARAQGWHGHLVVVGGGNPQVKAALQAEAERLGIAPWVSWRESEPDLPGLYAALDALVLASRSEGFPNVLAEAMACGTRCIATRVGDAPSVLGDLGTLIARDDPDALAVALQGVHGETPPPLAAQCRRHIVAHFSVDALVERTDTLLFSSWSR